MAYSRGTPVCRDLRLELLRVTEGVDAHGAEEVADALPHLAHRVGVAQGEGRRERPPVRPRQHRGEYVHREGQPVVPGDAEMVRVANGDPSGAGGAGRCRSADT